MAQIAEAHGRMKETAWKVKRRLKPDDVRKRTPIAFIGCLAASMFATVILTSGAHAFNRTKMPPFGDAQSSLRAIVRTPGPRLEQELRAAFERGLKVELLSAKKPDNCPYGWYEDKDIAAQGVLIDGRKWYPIQ